MTVHSHNSEHGDGSCRSREVTEHDEPAGPKTTPGQPHRLYRTREVWEILNLSRDTLFAILRSGELRSIKVGRLRMIPAEAIDEYVDMKLAEEDANHESG